MKLKRGDIVFYARILPYVNVYEVCELIIRSIQETYFVGVDKRDKRAYLFGYSALDKNVFKHRKDALETVIVAEENKPKVSEETYYEEY